MLLQGGPASHRAPKGRSRRSVPLGAPQQRFKPFVAASSPPAAARRGAPTGPRAAQPEAQVAPAATESRHATQTGHAKGPAEDKDVGFASSCVPLIWERMAHEHGSRVALHEPHRPDPQGGRDGVKVNFRELHSQMTTFAAGLRSLGLSKGDRVSLFSENSVRWLVADQGAMMCGAIGAVRGSTAPADELGFILRHSESVGLLVQDAAALDKLRGELAREDAPRLRFVVLLWGGPEAVAAAAAMTGAGQVLCFEDVVERGRACLDSFEVVQPQPEDVATLVYTSGTTGQPRGVMLTHGNLAYQVRNLPFFMRVAPGDTALSLLPPWHIYERTASYYILSCAATLVYSSVRRFKDDLAARPPDFLVCVPLVLDTLHSRVMARLKAMPAVRAAIAMALVNASIAFVRARRVVRGEDLEHARAPGPGKQPGTAGLWAALVVALLRPLYWLADLLVFGKVREAVGVRKAVISGGGGLPPHLDDFYEALGVKVLNGWGLSETSPVLACRTSSQNVRGSVGLPTPGTELRVVDPETLEPVPDGQQGLVLARGPGVMAGYWRDEAATQRAFRAGGGFFDTGDLGWRAPAGVPGSTVAGVLVLTGRSKDTIVLSSGKKVEPEPLESALCASPFIKHALVLGQDKRELGCLLYPDVDALEALAASRAPNTATAAAAAAGTSGTPASSSAAQNAAKAHAAGAGATAPAARPLPLTRAEVEVLLWEEVKRLNAARPDYHPYEHLAHVEVVLAPLSVEDGTLTRTMKLRRPEILKRYKPEVDWVLSRLRG